MTEESDRRVRRMYEKLLITRNAQLRYAASRRTAALGYIVTPDLVLQYNYVHRLMRSLYSGAVEDLCVRDGDIACSNLSSIETGPIGDRNESYPSELPVADEADYLASRIIHLLDKPIIVGDRELSVSVRDGFAVNIKTLEERYRSCIGQNERTERQLTETKRQLAASETTASELLENGTVEQRIMRMREETIRCETQLLGVRERLRSLRENNEQTREEVETLLRWLSPTTRGETNEKCLALLRDLVGTLQTERDAIASVLSRMETTGRRQQNNQSVDSVDRTRRVLNFISQLRVAILDVAPMPPQNKTSDRKATLVTIHGYCRYLVEKMRLVLTFLVIQSGYLNNIAVTAYKEYTPAVSNHTTKTRTRKLMARHGDEYREHWDRLYVLLEGILGDLPTLVKEFGMQTRTGNERHELKQLRSETRVSITAIRDLQISLNTLRSKRGKGRDAEVKADMKLRHSRRTTLMIELRAVLNDLITTSKTIGDEYIRFYCHIVNVYHRHGALPENRLAYSRLPMLTGFCQKVEDLTSAADRVLNFGTSPRMSRESHAELQRAIQNMRP